ncbi:alpha/beta hydrolase [Falsiroseomonas sp.]|uniref:alpha/beta hydrolase n=1 Tax=Falsiroseomonas sp. TaxID=2870721 RepID=UPI00272440BE|nr:alpha/beta fold hydrolase [Falsiroseomonas sp.]MDO9499606.1 alpha/beta fold hydrolase [Falsiroseomonas sp.]
MRPVTSCAKAPAMLSPLHAALFCAGALLAAPGPAAGETLLHAPGPQGRLEGAFTPGAPDGPMDGPVDRPVLLLVPGSGPTDRDGNGLPGLRPGTYRLLAEGLAARGIATLRIDKRGLHGSQAAVPDPEAVTMADYAADVGTWVATLRQETGARCIWLAGHSEGGLVVLLAAQTVPDLCGLVLLATPGRPLGALLREQLHAALPEGPLRAEAMAIIARLEAGQGLPETISPGLRPLFRPQIAGFLASVFALDPARLAAGTRLPLLVLQGLQDLQVGRADAEALAGANPAARLVLLPEANHVLKAVTDRADNLAAYGDPDRPLAPGVVEAIAGFLAAPPG